MRPDDRRRGLQRPRRRTGIRSALTMPAGKYTMALVLGTPDMKKLSVAYTDITLPGPDAYETALWPTDPIIVTTMDQVDAGPAADHPPRLLHLGRGQGRRPTPPARSPPARTWRSSSSSSAPPPRTPPTARSALDLEVNFEVQSLDGKPAIKWTPQSYELYLVNQPLPLFQTLQKLDEKGTVLGEREEAPGGREATAWRSPSPTRSRARRPIRRWPSRSSKPPSSGTPKGPPRGAVLFLVLLPFPGESLSSASLRALPLAPRPPWEPVRTVPPASRVPLSSNGDLRGNAHRRRERESRKWEKNLLFTSSGSRGVGVAIAAFSCSGARARNFSRAALASGTLFWPMRMVAHLVVGVGVVRA
ncbi:MAG: hypothetical protein MZU79_04010 [Anaerotruncus sp.]|nr:hypothetical protein [Anaerotruncus sp.]